MAETPLGPVTPASLPGDDAEQTSDNMELSSSHGQGSALTALMYRAQYLQDADTIRYLQAREQLLEHDLAAARKTIAEQIKTISKQRKKMQRRNKKIAKQSKTIVG